MTPEESESTSEVWGVWFEPTPAYANLGGKGGWVARPNGSTFMPRVYAETMADDGNRHCSAYWRYSAVRRIPAPPPPTVLIERLTLESTIRHEAYRVLESKLESAEKALRECAALFRPPDADKTPGWWGVWCWQESVPARGFWQDDEGTPLRTTHTEATRLAAASNETAAERADSFGWRYEARRVA